MDLLTPAIPETIELRSIVPLKLKTCVVLINFTAEHLGFVDETFKTKTGLLFKSQVHH